MLLGILERDIRMRRIRKMNQELLVDCNYIGDDSIGMN
jgi:hypothetical protein